nr:hypothetical protein [Actinomycetota bacterium]NIU65490.1 hypothetical protein [Actinomycetota bacterium]NIW27299.1 hypothetical protein [Actinomycetota bacterium]
MLWIGPILWPSGGGLLISDYDAIATDHQVYFMVELPWDTTNGTTFAGTTDANTSLARQLWTFGPFIASSTNLETSDEVPFPTG